ILGGGWVSIDIPIAIKVGKSRLFKGTIETEGLSEVKNLIRSFVANSSCLPVGRSPDRND
ncbi:hypothetical protein C7B61_12460, partial [filamentous cyanobacterium CCP1]